jgi:IS605 OrfB family transposase
MQLTAKVKLQPTDAQAIGLKRTLETANEACDYISQVAWNTRTFGKFQIQKLVYADVRSSFDLTAQVVIRCIAKVTDAYKLDRKTKRTFKPHGSIAYDARILSWRLDKNEISIWTVDGRQAIRFVCRERDKELLSGKRGESDLCLIRGEFYLLTACEVDEPSPKDVEDFLGIDLGVTNIATDSTGEVHQGKQIKSVRYRYRRLRAKLQRKGTQSARRRLRKLSGKERRFATDVNHQISKRIVAKAERTRQGIALEDLKGIRDRVRARKPQRATLHSWSFHQLRTFIEYKARLMGAPVATVDPRNTSRTCPCCGHIDQANRPNQATFSCVDCGFSGLADHIAAVNIRRAAVNPPNVPDTDVDFYSVAPGTSPRALAVGS